jgi:Flp pilus assembly protein TadD
MMRSTDRIFELQRELETNPSSRQFYQLGELLRRDGRWEEAAKALRAGLEHFPRYVAAWVSLGRADLARGEPLAAGSALTRALDLDAENPVAWRLLGEARLAAHEAEAALAAFRRAAALVPGDETLRATVARLEAEEAGTAAAEGPSPALLAPAVENRQAAPPFAPAAKALAGAAAVMEDPFAFAAPSAAGLAEQDVFEAVAAEPADESLVFGPLTELPVGETGPFLLTEPPWVTQTVAVAPLAAPEQEVVAVAPLAAPEQEVAAAPAPPAEEPSMELEAPEERAPAGGEVALPPPEEEPPSLVPEPSPTAPEWEPDMDTQPEVVLPPMERPPAAPPEASVEAARALLRQEDLAGAEAVLERVVAAEPSNREARDLLELVRDMHEPMPEAPAPASPKERKVAALQRWLACFTLARERATP